MASPINPPRGMRDFLPADKARRERALARIRASYTAHGFREIETPVMEDSSRLHAGLGGDNEKLAFGVLRRGLTAEDLSAAAAGGDVLGLVDLGLRFDLTVPLARYYASNRAQLPPVFRAIQIAPVWRAERPQKGRYRQFVQCDIDIIGEPGVLAEAELITATLAALAELGIEGTWVRINDRRLLAALLEHFGFPAERHAAALITIDKLDKLGPDGVLSELSEQGHDPVAVEALRAFLLRPQTMEYNPYGERAIRKELPQGFEHPAIDELLEIGSALEAALAADPGAYAGGLHGGVPLRFDPFLVRGMGYYTGAIFEIAHPEAGYSLGGGGRYDGMIGRFLGTEVPAVGFSIGFERIVELVQAQDAVTGATALLYDSAVPVATLLALKAGLRAAGHQVVLERAPKKTAAVLERLAAEGVDRFAFVRDAGAALDSLEFRPLSPGQRD